MTDETETLEAPKRGPGRPAKVAEQPQEPAPAGYVRCRITKFGDNQIFTGKHHRDVIHNSETGDEHEFFDTSEQDAHLRIFPRYRKGEYCVLPRKVALAQEAKGFLEIEE